MMRKRERIGRIEYLDLLKAISMFLVVYCHGVLLPYDSIMGNILMSVAWGAVPCFMMVSGAVMHQRKCFSWRTHLKHMGVTYITLIAWRVLYLLTYIVGDKFNGCSIGQVVSYLFFLQNLEGVDTGVMWYMIAYLGIMFLYPVTYYLFCGGKSGRQVAFFMLVLSGITGIIVPSGQWLINAILPSLGKQLDLNTVVNTLTIGNNTNLLFYFLLGAFLLEYQDALGEKWRCLGNHSNLFRSQIVRWGLCILLLLIGTTRLIIVKYVDTGYVIWADTYLNFGYSRVSTMLIAIGLYGSVECLGNLVQGKVKKILEETIGRNTLGIYYLHYIILTAFQWTTSYGLVRTHYFVGMNIMKAILLTTLCCGITMLMHKIPMIKRIC